MCDVIFILPIQQGFPNFLLRGPFLRICFFCGLQLYVTLLLLQDSPAIIIIKIRIQFIRQCDGCACFTLHNLSILGAICDKQTRKSDLTCSLDEMPSHTYVGVLYKKKSQHLHCCRDCVARSPIYRQARVTFHNFAEVNFRDFLLTETDV